MKHTKRCPDCGRFVPVDWDNCESCGFAPIMPEMPNLDRTASRNSGFPLVFFRYRNKRGEEKQHKVRVVRADGQHIQGFEVKNSWDPMSTGQFKTFNVASLVTLPVLAEFIQ